MGVPQKETDGKVELNGATFKLSGKAISVLFVSSYQF